MQTYFQELLGTINSYVWGLPLILLLLGTGLYLTVILKGIQFRKLYYSLYLALIKRKEDGDAEGDITHFQALMTALAATVGTGNIAGVATAIAIGGPGALFWMWVTGLVGMATKYTEAILGVKYRVKDKLGTMSGGPMYYISKGLGLKWLGAAFAFLAAMSAFGTGNMVQSNSVAQAMKSVFHIPSLYTGIVLALLTALVVLKGIKSIGQATSFLVPVMIVFYMAAASLILILNYKAIPEILSLIFTQAFNPTAATGGFAGATVYATMRIGVARGIFSNESGLGSSPIAAAAAQTKNPMTQALVSMTQTFIDTIVVCSFTGFAILSTGLWKSGKTGAELTSLAFEYNLSGIGDVIVAIGLITFAYSTILGWCYYGEKSIEYLLGERSVYPYRVLFCIFTALGAVLELNTVWAVSDIMNGMMAFPNLIGLLGLGMIAKRETDTSDL